MKSLLSAILIITGLNSTSQISNKEKCTLIQFVLNDSNILKNVFFDEPIGDTIYVVDTNQFFFELCSVSPIFDKSVKIVHKETEINTNNWRLVLEIEKIKKLTKTLVELKIFYKARNFYAIITYQKRNNKWVYFKYKEGYY